MAEPEDRPEQTPSEADSASQTPAFPRPESAPNEMVGRVAYPPSGAVVLGTPAEEARRRSVKEAQAFLDQALSRRWKGRVQALEAIAVHTAPMRRARQIVEFEQRKRVFGEPASGIKAPDRPKIRRSKHRRAQLEAEGKDVAQLDRLTIAYCWPRDHVDPRAEFADVSDVQELLVKLSRIRRYDPAYQDALNRLAREVVAGMPMEAFEDRAAALLRSAAA